jgi:hypothetical protein
MDRAMPSSEFTRFVTANGTLCSGHPALDVAMWGYLGAIISLVIEAILFFWLIRGLTKAILKKNILDCVVLSTLLCEIVKVFSVGGFFWATNFVPLVCFAYLIITRVFRIKLRIKWS